MRTAVDRFMRSELVMEGRLLEARRAGVPGGWLSLDATFLVEDTFKGQVTRGTRTRVVRSCWNQPAPRGLLGSPYADDYCPGDARPEITGVEPSGAEPGTRPDTWILYLERSADPGRWKEVRPHGYGDCGATRDALNPEDREGYERLRSRAGQAERRCQSR
jgi:hypothetical protein